MAKKHEEQSIANAVTMMRYAFHNILMATRTIELAILETFFGEAEKMSVNPRKYFTMIMSQRPVFHTNASTTMNK